MPDATISIGKNIEAEVSKDGKTLILKVKLAKSFGLSKSGKTDIIATSSGNVRLADTDAFMGLNIYRYPEPKED